MRKGQVPKRYKIRSHIDTEKYKTPEDISRELSVSLCKSQDVFLETLREAVISYKGIYPVSREIGCSPNSLYKSLKTGGEPYLSTVMNVLNALGVSLELTKV